MKKRVIDGIEVWRSSGNVYADLRLPDAEKLRIKTGLIIEIRKAMRRLGLTQQAAAKRMGITQPKVSVASRISPTCNRIPRRCIAPRRRYATRLK